MVAHPEGIFALAAIVHAPHARAKVAVYPVMSQPYDQYTPRSLGVFSKVIINESAWLRLLVTQHTPTGVTIYKIAHPFATLWL